jgi:hypothetical protein
MAMKYLDLHKYLKNMKKQVLLLNQDNTPLNIITIGKAYKLIARDKVWGDDNNEFYEVVSVSLFFQKTSVLNKFLNNQRLINNSTTFKIYKLLFIIYIIYYEYKINYGN